jgi:hypothetical protein
MRFCREGHAARTLNPGGFTHRTSKPHAGLEARPDATERDDGVSEPAWFALASGPCSVRLSGVPVPAFPIGRGRSFGS